jgi:hypothetical protein
VIPPPDRSEAAAYYFRYIDRVPAGDPLGELARQVDEARRLFGGISEEKSLHRYAPGKWSIRGVLNHVNDTERVFVYRALWFARGFASELPSFEQEIASPASRADDVPWAAHVEEFEAVRRGTLAFFRNLPADAWPRAGVASGYSFSVRALAYITAGHAAHHLAVLREKYLEEAS